MKFISYAQNFEDVILNRAFKGRDDGFYIDVGAAHPTGHSVTKNFYDRGWRGINIEPGSTFFGLIESERVEDLNLNIGLSNIAGELTFFEAPDSLGISTFNREWSRDWNSREGWKFVERKVPILTLKQICEAHVRGPIDFLKIDVEGHEREVIDGGDFSRWRPRIVLAEGEREHYQATLLASGYLHAVNDGVNHYFVREEDRDLIPALAAPVSLVNDNFELYEYTQQIKDLRWLLDQERSQHEQTRTLVARAS
ncbi:FkbM family methyltransferase [Tundrisphaera lichenicola]|uniref:FkbM family methyltransferase n=1 Tax=Tundrisphaera lichenicola TaxID=2029860 RepID=UPI003EB7A604